MRASIDAMVCGVHARVVRIKRPGHGEAIGAMGLTTMRSLGIKSAGPIIIYGGLRACDIEKPRCHVKRHRLVRRREVSHLR
jgi:hypothetical protein